MLGAVLLSSVDRPASSATMAALLAPLLLSLLAVAPAKAALPKPASKLIQEDWTEGNKNLDMIKRINKIINDMRREVESHLSSDADIFSEHQLEDELIKQYIIHFDGDALDEWANVYAFQNDQAKVWLEKLKEVIDPSDTEKDNIFEVIVAEDNFEYICKDINSGWKYVANLWVAGNYLWAQAHIQSGANSTAEVNEIQTEAEEDIVRFHSLKEAAWRDHCSDDCFSIGTTYLADDKYAIMLENGTSERCQDRCQTFEGCFCIGIKQS